MLSVHGKHRFGFHAGISLWPRIAAATLIVLAVLSAGSAEAQKGKRPQPTAEQAGTRPADIDRNGVLILVRSALLALDQANKTGNYTVLRDLGAPGFQANTAAKLAEIFVTQRNDGLDLGGVAVLEPQLTLLPQIEPNGMLRMAGFFPSVPAQVNFELLYAPVDREWRLFGISVNVSEGGPKAPEAAPQAAVPQQPAELPDPPTPTVNPRKQPVARAQ